MWAFFTNVKQAYNTDYENIYLLLLAHLLTCRCGSPVVALNHGLKFDFVKKIGLLALILPNILCFQTRPQILRS